MKPQDTNIFKDQFNFEASGAKLNHNVEILDTDARLDSKTHSAADPSGDMTLSFSKNR